MTAVTSRSQTRMQPPVQPQKKAGPNANQTNHQSIQIEATRLTLEKIKHLANGLTSVEFLDVPKKKEVYVREQILQGDQLPPVMREKFAGYTICACKDRALLIFAVTRAHKHLANTFPEFKDLKKEIDSLTPYQKTIYATISEGVCYSFFIPKNDPAVTQALAPLKLPETLKQIAMTEDMTNVTMKSIYSSRLVMRQVLNATYEYTASKAFEDPAQNKWGANKLKGLAALSVQKVILS
jgi:hypothetical protein